MWELVKKTGVVHLYPCIWTGGLSQDRNACADGNLQVATFIWSNTSRVSQSDTAVVRLYSIQYFEFRP